MRLSIHRRFSAEAHSDRQSLDIFRTLISGKTPCVRDRMLHASKFSKNSVTHLGESLPGLQIARPDALETVGGETEFTVESLQVSADPAP